MEKLNAEFFFNNLIFTLIFLVACFIQISLNFLSIFVISQPYILAIVFFLTIKRVKFETSSVWVIIYGFTTIELQGFLNNKCFYIFFNIHI